MPTLVAAREAMGTRFELALVGQDPDLLRAAAEEALDEIQGLDRRWSAFRADSDVARMNRRAAYEPVRVEPRLFSLLERTRSLVSQTGGALDPTVGALMTLWGFRNPAAQPPDRPPVPTCPNDAWGIGSGTHTPKPTARPQPTVLPPTPQDIAMAQAACGMDKVHLDPTTSTVRYLVPGLQLDLGAVGKGAALDAAAEICRGAGVEAGLIHAGTSTIVAWGRPHPGTGWRVGIPRPEAGRAGIRAADLETGARPGRLWGETELRDQALGVSAIWGRGPTTAASGPGHVLDPRTGRPVEHTLMSAVLARSGFEADAFSTALLVGGTALQSQLAELTPGWRSLVVQCDPADGRPRLLDCGLF